MGMHCQMRPGEVVEMRLPDGGSITVRVESAGASRASLDITAPASIRITRPDRGHQNRKSVTSGG